MKYFALIAAAFVIFTACSYAKGPDTLVVASWNLENLFDTVHDQNMIDTDFTPAGIYKWTAERLDKKLKDMAEIIQSMNDGKGPDIMGFVECEHQWLIDTMIARHLNNRHYKVAYAESPDMRGIDNGLIYDSELFTLESFLTHIVELPDKTPTRFVFNANLIDNRKDTIHVFVNHWPSRRAGENESEKNRIAAAKKLKENVDLFFKQNKNSNIIIVGDFNDEPGNVSIADTLGAKPLLCDDSDKASDALYNAAYETWQNKQGTLKFGNTWNLLDQLIVSGGMLDNSGLKYICGSFQIYKPDQIIQKEGKYNGSPFPTYGGRKYLGGYSDHFPILGKFIYIE